MDPQVQEYINGLVQSSLQAPAFQNLNEEQKAKKNEQLQDYFYQVVLNSLIDNLSDDQLNQIEGMDPASPELQAKFQQFAAEIPGFIYTLQEKLEQEANQIKQTGQIPS